MTKEQLGTLITLKYALGLCEDAGISFSNTSLRIDFEEDSSKYLERLSATKLSSFIDSTSREMLEEHFKND